MSPYPLWPCIPFVFVSLLSPIISYPFLNEPFIPDTSLSFYVLLLSLCPLCPRVPFVPVPLLSPTYHLLSQYPVSIHRICNSITITITVLIILNITVVFLFITISLSQLFCPFIPFLFPCPPRIPFACIIFVTVFLLSLHLFCLSIPCIPRPVSHFVPISLLKAHLLFLLWTHKQTTTPKSKELLTAYRRRAKFALLEPARASASLSSSLQLAGILTSKSAPDEESNHSLGTERHSLTPLRHQMG